MPFYRYAIYTRQEEMKTILEQGDKERMEVIRKIFKLDEYKNILDNISLALQKLRDEQKEREGFIKGLAGREEELESKREELNQVIEDMALTNKRISELAEEIMGLEENYRKMEKLKQRISEIEGEIKGILLLLLSSLMPTIWEVTNLLSSVGVMGLLTSFIST